MLEFEGRQIPTELKEIVDPRRAVLLVWDMQNDQAGGSFNKEALIRSSPPLIAAAAQAKIKTVYTRQTPFLWKDEAVTWIRRAMRDQKVDCLVLPTVGRGCNVVHRLQRSIRRGCTTGGCRNQCPK